MARLIAYLSLAAFLMAFVPFLHPGIPTGHDILTHLIYLRKFQDAFFAGQFPVRFNDWFVAGLNQPLSNFYQPAFYYIFLIPRLIGIPNTESLKIVILGLWLLSGLLMYLFTKRHFGILGGILGAAFYMFAPYHIEDFVVRAAFSEFTALAFVPGIFWAIKAFWDTGKGVYLSLTSIFIALVVLSHPPILIMYVPILAGYVGYLWWQGNVHLFTRHSGKRSSALQNERIQNLSGRDVTAVRDSGVASLPRMTSMNSLLPLSLSFLFSLGLLSFFVLPALFEQKYIQIIFMRSGYYDFHNHFVCLSQLFVPNWGYGLSTNGCSDGMSFQIGLPHLLVVGVVIYFLVERILSFPRKRESRPRSGFPIRSGMTKDASGMTVLVLLFLSFLAFYVFMTLEISLPFWENLPLVPFIQYSWRFLAVIMFVIAFLAASIPGFFSPHPLSFPPASPKLPLRPQSEASQRGERKRESSSRSGFPIRSGMTKDASGMTKEEGVRTDHLKGVASNKSLVAFAVLILLLPIFYAWYLHPLRYFGKNEVDFDSPKFLSGVKPETGNLLPETGYMPKIAEVLPPIDEIPESEARILSGEGDINVVKLAAHRKEYTITVSSLQNLPSPSPSPLGRGAGVRGQASMTKIRFYTHYFPGWKVRVDGKPLSLCQSPGVASNATTTFDGGVNVRHPEGVIGSVIGTAGSCVSYDNIYGYMDVSIPKGKHNVLLSFENTPVRTAGNWISIFSILAVIGLIFFPKKILL